MRVALVNPRWSFDGSIYFGCSAPHLPLEFGYARALLAQAGHRSLLVDAHLFDVSTDEIPRQVADFGAEMTVVTTAPSYLFWRCAPPELRVPRETLQALAGIGGLKVAVGPHPSTTPRTAVRKLGCDVAVMGECEETLTRLATGERQGLPGIAYADGDAVRVNGGPQAARFVDSAALAWDERAIALHHHHHHRFDLVDAGKPSGPGAEVEASRGCPYRCTFCAKETFRDAYRRRALPLLLAEIDGLLSQGVEYVYFIDEIFLPDRGLLEALAARSLRFGVQTRIDLWKPDMLALLGRAGCVSIEAGVESLTANGRERLAKNCRIDTAALTERLIFAKQHVPFVQGNLIATADDDPEAIAAWRSELRDNGVWANDPVPMYPYPGSPDYRLRWGLPDDEAWERSHAAYLETFDRFSDLQSERPAALAELERCCAS
ncbi:MAG: TIGR04295 family B12-binding domain-containing radical SAM protein [Rhodospirillales bacterium]|nr:TIGR04295 family B12-binding domain-containing radical SAM protein [Rhodospirillales bacterium]